MDTHKMVVFPPGMQLGRDTEPKSDKTPPTTHYLARGARPPKALCGASEPGPIDLTPYGGVVSCEACRELRPDLAAMEPGS